MISLSKRIAALALCCTAVGCVPSLDGNEPREPNKKVPESFGSSAGTSEAQKKWNEFFVSPELKGLIETALKNNQELNIQLQEIIIAKNEVYARKGEYLPKVNARGGAGIEKPGDHTSQGVSDDAHGVPDNLGNFQFGFTGTWEVDIWKRLRNAAAAADMRYRSSIEARNWTITQLVAEISRSYYELLALDQQIDILKKNIELQTNVLEIVRLEKIAAKVTELAVQRFEAEVLKNRSRLFDVEQERVQTENRINFLVGRYPQKIERDMEELNAPLPANLQSGLPSQLLENRPDVRQAELQLEAAKLDVKVAKAAFYPALSIDASLGYRSFSAAHIIDTPGSIAYDLAGNLTAPLLNRQAITADYRSANAKQLQAVFNYEKTLLQAFTDVANTLSLIANLQKSYELQSQQVETLARATDTSQILFQSARADYMEVLLTRRDSLEAQLERLETKKRQYGGMVSIYQALGGGWRPVDNAQNGNTNAPTPPPANAPPAGAPAGGGK